MYGKFVKLNNGVDVFVSCCPSTTKDELYKMALRKYELYITGEISSLT